jgi:hypothetical protein
MFHIASLGPNANGWSEINPELFEKIRAGVDSVRLYARLMEQAYSPNRQLACNWLLNTTELGVPFYRYADGTVTEEQRTAIFLQYLLSHVTYPLAIATRAGRPGRVATPNTWKRNVKSQLTSYASQRGFSVEDFFKVMTGSREGLADIYADTDRYAEALNAVYMEYSTERRFQPLGWAGKNDAEQRVLIEELKTKHRDHIGSDYKAPENVREALVANYNVLRLFVRPSFWANSVEDPVVYPTNPLTQGLEPLPVRDLRLDANPAHVAARIVARSRAHWADDGNRPGWGEGTVPGSRLGGTRGAPSHEARPFEWEAYGELRELSLDTETMALVQGSTDMYTRLSYIFSRILDRMERAHAIAHVFSRISRFNSLARVDNNMVLPETYVCLRPFITLRTGAAIYVVPRVGRTLTSRLRTVTSYDSVHKEIHVSLDMHLANFVKESRRITILPQAMLLGYLSGGSTHFVRPVYRSDQLDRSRAEFPRSAGALDHAQHQEHDSQERQ